MRTGGCHGAGVRVWIEHHRVTGQVRELERPRDPAMREADARLRRRLGETANRASPRARARRPTSRKSARLLSSMATLVSRPVHRSSPERRGRRGQSRTWAVRTLGRLGERRSRSCASTQTSSAASGRADAELLQLLRRCGRALEREPAMLGGVAAHLLRPDPLSFSHPAFQRAQQPRGTVAGVVQLELGRRPGSVNGSIALPPCPGRGASSGPAHPTPSCRVGRGR